jgi:hypothetical protein
MRTLRIAFSLAIATLLLAAAVLGQAQPPAQGQVLGQAQAPAQGQAAPAGPQWKDRAEYDLYESATKQTDPAKRLEILNTWAAKYPNSDYKSTRLQLTIVAQAALRQADKVLETGAEILAGDPKNLTAFFMMAQNTLALAKPTPEQFSLGEKAARALVTDTDSLKPAGMADAAWASAKAEATNQGHTTLGWIAMQRKENEVAEKEFTTLLQTNAGNAQASYWLGTVVLAQRNPDKQSAALFHFTRAAFYTGPGALTAEGRKQIENYIIPIYTKFHGSAEGFDDLRKLALASAFPPGDLKIESGGEIALKKEEDFKKNNPMLALFQSVKTALTDAGGTAYFEGTVKGALLPGGAGGVTRFKGKLVSATPPKNPKQLVLAISDAETPEVTLVLEEPLVGTAPKGTDLEFEGVGAAFTASPFNLTFEVDKDKLFGWPAPAPAAKKGPAGTKKAAPPPKKP